MEGVAWTAIGLLGAGLFGLFGSFIYLGGRVDSLATRLDARIDAQGADLGARIDAQGAELGARIREQGQELGARLDRLAAALDDHVRRHAG